MPHHLTSLFICIDSKHVCTNVRFCTEKIKKFSWLLQNIQLDIYMEKKFGLVRTTNII